MIKEAIDRILELSKPMIVKDANDREYSTKSLEPIKDQSEKLVSQTLTGLLDYMASLYAKDLKHEGLSYVFNITSPHRVEIISETLPDWLERDILAAANCKEFIVSDFFDRWMDCEKFIIRLQTYFAPTEDLARLMHLVGSVNKASVVTNEDDGVTQRTTIKKGVALQKDVTIKNPFVLAPYRTFPEIAQPASPFVLRLKEYGDEVQVSLWEADKGRWKLEAIKLIREYLRRSEPALPIIG